MSVLNNTIPLSKIVKAATIDLGEDFTKVEATFNHHAVRGFKKLSNELLRLGIKKIILPIHQSLKTVTLPLDFKSESFVGIIDSNGYKHAFENTPTITTEVEEEQCVDKCEKCHQALDICEKLEVTEERYNVEINNQTYENITYRYLEAGTYYVIKKLWIFNTVLQQAEKITTKEFITDFDMLECGCIAPSQENINKIQEHCFDCYSSCYTPCCYGDINGLGGYKIYEEKGIIQFDRRIQYDKIYLEYTGCLPKKNGVFHVPEVAEETLIAFVKHQSQQHKNAVSLGEKDRLWKRYITEKNNLSVIIGRISLSSFRQIMYKGPKFNIREEDYCNFVSTLNYNTTTTLPAPSATVFIPPPVKQAGLAIGTFRYIGVGNEDNFTETQLINKKIFGVFKDGILFVLVPESAILDPNKKEVKYIKATGQFIFTVSFQPGEDAFIQYQDIDGPPPPPPPVNTRIFDNTFDNTFN